MEILLKYPTRGRPAQFLKTLEDWLYRASNLSKISLLVSYDHDDPSMTPKVLEEVARMHPRTASVRGNSKTKIAACNADLKEYPGNWDVVLLLSDDMFCTQSGWDEEIRKHMIANFPDTDGALWFFDGQQRKINTLECVGRKRYERFGYIYHPSYASFYPDNEATEVGLRDGMLIFIENPICSHEHPAWGGGMKRDALYVRNDRYWSLDEVNYQNRKLAGFPSVSG